MTYFLVHTNDITLDDSQYDTSMKDQKQKTAGLVSVKFQN